MDEILARIIYNLSLHLVHYVVQFQHLILSTKYGNVILSNSYANDLLHSVHLFGFSIEWLNYVFSKGYLHLKDRIWTFNVIDKIWIIYEFYEIFIWMICYTHCILQNDFIFMHFSIPLNKFMYSVIFF